MKRGREGEGEEEQEQEQAAPAPMAAPPARNPPVASRGRRPRRHHLEPGTSHRRVLTRNGRVPTWDDSVDFVLSVRDALDRAKYREFLNVISRIDSIGVRGIADRMKVLLRGYPDLKRRLNMFLPAQYELSLRDEDDDQ